MWRETHLIRISMLVLPTNQINKNYQIKCRNNDIRTLGETGKKIFLT